MDVFSFYRSVIQDQMKCFHISKKMLRASLAVIDKAYGSKSLKNGQTFVDYNVPSHRCAYLWKFGPLHTKMAEKYFCRLLEENSETHTILDRKSVLKICCLGGGPGTEVLGLLLCLASFPCIYEKIREITVLDVCGGWINTFQRIVAKFRKRGIATSPENVGNCNNFHFNFVEVDLLEELADPALSAIQQADIVCMVKFVSTIALRHRVGMMFQDLACNIKNDAAIMFIDNLRRDAYRPINEVFKANGLRYVLGGPLHDDAFVLKGDYPLKAYKALTGIAPLKSCKLTILGWIKVYPLLTNISPHEHVQVDFDDWKWDSKMKRRSKANSMNLTISYSGLKGQTITMHLRRRLDVNQIV